ncbi:unnamed protein product, partial [Owenia fusiformis]
MTSTVTHSTTDTKIDVTPTELFLNNSSTNPTSGSPAHGCNNVNNCSGHGYCVGPDVCKCHDGFAGRKCKRCSKDRFGPTCSKCKDCEEGRCNEITGICDITTTKRVHTDVMRETTSSP